MTAKILAFPGTTVPEGSRCDGLDPVMLIDAFCGRAGVSVEDAARFGLFMARCSRLNLDLLSDMHGIRDRDAELREAIERGAADYRSGVFSTAILETLARMVPCDAAFVIAYRYTTIRANCPTTADMFGHLVDHQMMRSMERGANRFSVVRPGEGA